MRWPWQGRDEPQGDDVERFDDIVEDDPELEGDDESAGDEEEVSEEARAYAERIAGEREAALLAKVRQNLQAQGLDYTGDGAAIRDLNAFAARFVGQPAETQPERKPDVAATPDPYEALGERPDPSYEPEAARDWDRRYRAAIKAEALAEMAPQIQRMQATIAQTQVATATERVQRLLEDNGLGLLAEHPDFAAEFGQALLQQPMETWSEPGVLTGIAGWVIPRLKKLEGQRREQPRGDDGRFEADANQRSLRQVAAPRESGRPAGNPAANMDTVTRQMAARMGISPEEWAHLKETENLEQHQEWERRRARSGRR
jgi:hypothetical protein